MNGMQELTYAYAGKLKRVSVYQNEETGEIYRSLRIAGIGATIKVVVDAEQADKHQKDVGKMVIARGEQEYDAKTDRCKFLYGSVELAK